MDSLNIALRDLQYTPDENWYGREQLEIVADDLGKGTPSTASIYIEVTPVNDAPTITHIDTLTLKEDIVTPWSFTNVSI